MACCLASRLRKADTALTTCCHQCLHGSRTHTKVLYKLFIKAHLYKTVWKDTMNQLRRSLNKLGLTVDLNKVDYDEDTQHFTAEQKSRMLPTVDLVLLGREGKRFVGFPVHRAVIAVHSSILDRAVHDLYDDDDCQPMRLPMIDDSCPAIRAALAHVYNSRNVHEKNSMERSLDDIVNSCSLLDLCHKYGIDSVIQQQEAVLLHPLYKALARFCDKPRYNVTTSEMAEVLPKVVTLVVVFEKCKLKALVALCDAFMVIHFRHHQSAIKAALKAQASGNSMYEIAEFFERRTKCGMGIEPDDMKMRTVCIDLGVKLVGSQWHVCPGVITKLLWVVQNT